MSGGAVMRDILGQGRDREPGPWPRRLAVIAALLLVAVLGAVYLPGQLRGPGRPQQSPATSPAPSAASPGYLGPVQPPGPSVPWDGRETLLVSGGQPARLWPATGSTRTIGGLPRAGSGYTFTRVGGGWAIQVGLAVGTGCGDCGTLPLPVYFLGDQARSVTRVGLANLVAPGAAPGELWLTSYRPGADIPRAAGAAQEISAAGTPLGPKLSLPAGQVIAQATDGGLLLAPATPTPGTMTDTLWNPASRRANRTFEGVVAANPHEIAWAPQCGKTGASACRVQVLDLAAGRLSTIALPPGNSAASGAFSPDGQFLAIEASFDNSGSLAAQLYAASVGDGRLTAMPGTQVSSDALTGFGWPTSGDSLVAELSFTTNVQVASWRPGATTPAVAGIRPGQDSSSLVLG